MVEAVNKGLKMIRIEGKCPEQVWVKVGELNSVKTKLILGRGTAKETVDVDLEKDSGVSRVHAEFYFDETYKNLLIKQVGQAITGFVIDQQPIQLLKDYAIDIGAKMKLNLVVESLYPAAQHQNSGIIFSPQIPQQGLTRGTGEYGGKVDRAHLQLSLTKYSGKNKNERSWDPFEVELTGTKSFKIDNSYFEPGELSDNQKVDLEVTYNESDAKCQYWSIKNNDPKCLQSSNDFVVLHLKLKQHLLDKNQPSPSYVVHTDSNPYKATLMFANNVYKTEWIN